MQYAPGLLLVGLITAFSYIAAGVFGLPVMIVALILGLLVHELPRPRVVDKGLDFSARTVLRIGVALLGAGITLQQIATLGIGVVLLVVAGVGFTILCGVLIGRVMKLDRASGLIYGGAVAICGASAAMAISSALPDTERNRATTALAVVGVTIISTIAMVVYPIVANGLGLSEHLAGVFFGAAIHDVAQVVGAGYMVSDYAGETATVVKLLRIACLVPVVATIAWAVNSQLSESLPDHKDQEEPSQLRRMSGPQLLPWFLVAFVALSAIASTSVIPAFVLESLASSAKVLLVAAVAALGCKTSIHQLLKIGLKPVAMLMVPTLALMAGVLASLIIFEGAI